jgi:hypothetical protein
VDYRWGRVSGFAISSQVTPESALRSRVYTAISYRLPRDLPFGLVSRALQPLVRWYTGQVLVQDVEIMKVQSEGLRGEGGGVFTSTEARGRGRFAAARRGAPDHLLDVAPQASAGSNAGRARGNSVRGALALVTA